MQNEKLNLLPGAEQSSSGRKKGHCLLSSRRRHANKTRRVDKNKWDRTQHPSAGWTAQAYHQEGKIINK